jgi:hypothetical protein
MLNMSETQKNNLEIRGAWFGVIGSGIATVVGLIMGIFNLSMLTKFPGTIGEYRTYFESMGGVDIANALLIVLPIIYWVTFLVGIIGLLVSLFRTNIGIRFSGFILTGTAIASIGCLSGCLISLSDQFNKIITLIGSEPQELATYGITVPQLLFWPAIALSVLWLVGSVFMFLAAPMNEAKFRTRRMKILARADTAERAGRPREAINLYSLAGDISMKLKEEDKASEYFAKSRDIREVAIQAVLEAEEKQKREELAARRSKLEEKRREILMQADKAEESEDWARASVIYKEAASLSVDLGEKKLAAQFTAKSKELQKRAKKTRREVEETPTEEPPPEG